MKRVLDMGCGPTPTVLEAIYDIGHNVDYVGLDVEKVVETAKARHPQASFVKCLVPYDLKPLELDQFDMVTGFTFFEYLNRPEKAATVCGINKVLKVGGEIVSTYPKSSEKDAMEMEQFFKSLGYYMKRRYVALDYEDIEGSRYFWVVEGTKKSDTDTLDKFSKYKAMSYLKAGKVREARAFNYSLGDLAKELLELETIDVNAVPPEIPEYANRLKDLEKEIVEIEDVVSSITPKMRMISRNFNTYRKAKGRLGDLQKEKSELAKEYTEKLKDFGPPLKI